VEGTEVSFRHEHRGDEQQADFAAVRNPCIADEGLGPVVECTETGLTPCGWILTPRTTEPTFHRTVSNWASTFGDVHITEQYSRRCCSVGDADTADFHDAATKADWLELAFSGIHQESLPEMGEFFATFADETFSSTNRHHGRRSNMPKRASWKPLE